MKDLDKHKFITYGRGTPSPVYNPDWALKVGTKDGKKRKSLMKVNSVYVYFLAVQSGVGSAALPDYMYLLTMLVILRKFCLILKDPNRNSFVVSQL